MELTLLLEAAIAIRSGKLVAFPTETVYGLGANALDPYAVARIFEAKERPRFNPLIVHVKDTGQAREIAEVFPAHAEKLAEAFWPGPLTLVLPKKAIIPDIVSGGLASVGIRVPRHPIAQRLLQLCEVPIAAPSANQFGRLSPTTTQSVMEQMHGKIEMILEGGACEVGVESTVVGLFAEGAFLIRPGGIPREAIEGVIGPLKKVDPNGPILGPGMLRQHYAPTTRLKVFPRGELPLASLPSKVGVLAWNGEHVPGDARQVEVLSVHADLTEGAHHLFAALRRLDLAGVEEIWAEQVPNVGLGEAINDRLFRASSLT